MKKRFLPFLILITLSVNIPNLVCALAPEGGKTKKEARESEKLSSGITNGNQYLQTIRANQHTGEIDPADLLAARFQSDLLTGKRQTFELNWHSLGPDNYGGRSRAIIIDKNDETGNTIIAASVTGGVWKSTNFGLSWTKVNQGNENLNVSCMHQMENGTFLAGTGEMFNVEEFSAFSDMGYSSGFMGKGLFQSSDGDNFTLVSGTAPEMNNDEAMWAYINGISSNGGKVMAATNTGLYYTDQLGQSWNIATDNEGNELSMMATDVVAASNGTLVTVVDNLVYASSSGNAAAMQLVSNDTIDTKLPVSGVGRIKLAIAPSDPNVVYASIVSNSGVLKGIYKSTNKGFDWEVILPENSSIFIFAFNNPNSGVGNYNNTIRVHPDDAGRIFVGGLTLWEGKDVDGSGFYAFTLRSIGPINIIDAFLPFGVNDLSFHPAKPGQMVVATNGGIWKTNTTGNSYFSYQSINRDFVTNQFYTVAPSGAENYILGGGEELGTIFISGDGNTERAGEEIWFGPTQNGFFPINVGSYCAVSLIDPDIFFYSTAYTSERTNFAVRSEDRGQNISAQYLIEDIYSGDFAQNYITPILLWESFDDDFGRDSVIFRARQDYSSGTTLQVLSNNRGQPFYYTLTEDLNSGDSIFVRDPVVARHIIAKNDNIWMTLEGLNFGKTPEWFNIAGFSTGFDGMPFCASISADGNHLFVGTIDGKLYRISNLSLAYNFERADISSPGCLIATRELEIFTPSGDPIDQVITSVAVDPQDANHIVITLGNYGNEHYIYRSTDALSDQATFSSVQSNLPVMPVYSSLIEMQNPDIAMVGTENGVFMTDNFTSANPEWNAAMNTMGEVPVMMLKQQIVNKLADTVVLINGNETTLLLYPGVSNPGIIYAATYGKGLYRVNAYRKPVGIDENGEMVYDSNDPIDVKIMPNPVHTEATLQIKLDSRKEIRIRVLDINGRDVMESNNSVLNKGTHNLNLNTSDLAPGIYILDVRSGSERTSIKFVKQ